MVFLSCQSEGNVGKPNILIKYRLELMSLTLMMMYTSLNSLLEGFEDMIGPFIGTIICIAWIVPFLIQLLIAYWMYKDAEKRGEEGVLWLIVGILGGVIGLIIWLIVRPDVYEKRVPRNKQYNTRGGGTSQFTPNVPKREGARRRPRQRKRQRPAPGKPCPDCDHSMRWIKEQKQWFCDVCREYK